MKHVLGLVILTFFLVCSLSGLALGRGNPHAGGSRDGGTNAGNPPGNSQREEHGRGNPNAEKRDAQPDPAKPNVTNPGADTNVNRGSTGSPSGEPGRANVTNNAPAKENHAKPKGTSKSSVRQHPQNHGAVVSGAAKSGIHGQTLSTIARSKAGKPLGSKPKSVQGAPIQGKQNKTQTPAASPK